MCWRPRTLPWSGRGRSRTLKHPATGGEPPTQTAAAAVQGMQPIHTVSQMPGVQSGSCGGRCSGWMAHPTAPACGRAQTCLDASTP